MDERRLHAALRRALMLGVRWEIGRSIALLPLSAMWLLACGDPGNTPDTDTLAKIRPTQGDSTVYRGYGDVEFQVYDSDSGDHRVWYTRSGEHAVPGDDRNPADGVPDFVQRVAETADDVLASLVDAGWRAPLSDTELGQRRTPDDGPAFDIYLVNFERADGLYFSEACTPSLPARCSGYIAMENDFARSGYRNYEEGVRVLVSHEYFHAVQAAYASDLPPWFSEGTATWHEEVFDPSQQDFEYLASEYFRHPGRSLNGPTRGTFDGYSYGTAVFPYFVAERLGEPVLIEVFEQIALGAGIEEALVETIGAIESFDAVFAEFVAWTLATGERALPGFGFPMASSFPTLEAIAIDAGSDVNWDISVDSWASSAAVVERPRAVRLELRSLDGFNDEAVLAVVQPDGAASAVFSFVRVGEALELNAGEPVWIAVANPGAISTTAARVAVRAVSVPDVPEDGSGLGTGGAGEPETEPAPAANNAGGCAAAAPGAAPLTWLLLAAIAPIRRRSLTPSRHAS